MSSKIIFFICLMVVSAHAMEQAEKHEDWAYKSFVKIFVASYREKELRENENFFSAILGADKKTVQSMLFKNHYLRTARHRETKGNGFHVLAMKYCTKLFPKTEKSADFYKITLDINNDREIAEILFKNQVHYNEKDIEGCTPLHFIAASNNIDLLKKFLEFPNLAIDAQDNSGETPLHVAVRENSKDFVQLLLTRKAVVEMPNNIGNTPLHCAAALDFDPIDQLISDYGIDIENKAGLTPLALAILADKKKACNVLKRRGASVEKAQQGIGVYLTIKDESGRTPLFYAAHNNHELVKKFLRYKPDLSVQDKDGLTAVHLAARYNQIETIRTMLQQNNAQENRRIVNIADTKYGQTPLHVAAAFFCHEIIELLVQAGADVMAKRKEILPSIKEATPLDCAQHSARTTNYFFQIWYASRISRTLQLLKAPATKETRTKSQI